jgi:Tfp pilus assembly protein PilX
MNMKSSLSFCQRGVILLIALIVLIAMTLSALALIRSVNTTNLVSGNLAFRESALLYAERAAEHAVAWLVAKANAGGGDLWHDVSGSGYLAVHQDPDPGSANRRNWDELWRNLLEGKAASVPAIGDGGTDVTGNRVKYVIQRLCDEEGNPLGVECSRPPHEGKGASKVAGSASAGLTNPQVYYRITARVDGPRNTVAYTQTIVAL